MKTELGLKGDYFSLNIMINKDIAGVLNQIADLLEILQESHFRVIAYRKAASVVESLPEDISNMVERGELQDLSGIGAHIAKRLEELLKTGRMKYYEELKQKVPEGLLELIKIRGLGPKTTVAVYKNLGIASVGELEKAVREHKIREIKGLGEKVEKNIIKNIKEMKKYEKRILLAEAYPVAREIIDKLRKQPFIINAEAAGSLRRMRRTIGDIDLLAGSEEPEKVMDYFTTMPFVVDIEAKGKTKSTIAHKSGRKVDLRVVTPDQYGSALQYFTGSKQHSIHLRGIAKDKGLKISEYGIFKAATGERLGGKTEADIYSKLGLPVIEPELREDKGEIEAAYEGELPRLITINDIKGDLHVHTKKSDGLNSIEEMVAKAKRLGYSYLCISDHAQNLKVAGGLTTEELEVQIKNIRKINKREASFRVLAGAELNIDNDGNVDYDTSLLKQLDFVCASIHTGFTQSKKQLTERMQKAIENPNINLICHPTAEIINQRAPYELDLSVIFKAAAKAKTALELNSYPNRLDLRTDYLRAAKRAGVKIAINTDAHNYNHLQYLFYGVAIARRGWLEKEDVINTWSLNRLLEFAGR